MDGYSNNAGRFRAEIGTNNNSDKDSESGQKTSAAVHLENPETETRWYFKYFLGKLHQIYGGLTLEREPLLLAVVITSLDNHNIKQYRCILWQKAGSQKLCLPYYPSNPLTPKKILSYFGVHRCEKGPKEITNPEVQKDLMTLEEQEGSVNFKFGVLYCKEGQTSDEDMYNNEDASENFWNFVDLLGDRIQLKNFDHFKGGLDTKNDTTGTESLYTVYEGHEIMFHVSNLLPYSYDQRQQIERKRHVGNDIVNIIFVDGTESESSPSWRPSMMKTHFTHIFALVTYDDEQSTYRLHVYAEESVPLFGPPLPSPPEFFDKNEFRDFLLVKLINGEKAAFHSPVFAQKRMRTLDMLISNTLETYSLDNVSMLNRRTFSDIVLDQSNEITTTKEQTRNDEFIDYGQQLKVNIIIRGDAPTSKITTGNLRKGPWQPYVFHCDFHNEITCADAWGSKLIVGADQGTFLLEENCPPVLLLDRTVDIKQIEVIESVNVLVIRHEKNKESRVSILRLTVPSTFWPLDRNSLKEFILDKSKGCHLIAVNKAIMQPLRLVLSVGRRLHIYQWRYNTGGASLSSWNQFTNTEDNASFHFVRDLPTFEPAQIITVVECVGKEQICIGYRNQFDLIDEKTGDTVHLYRADGNKTQVVAAIDVCADDEPELLLCHNRTCHFQKLTDKGRCSNGTEFNFSWSFEPTNVVIAFPYLLAFTKNSVEIRMLINGCLVHTMTVPNCTLISAKSDIYFTTTAENLIHMVCGKENSTNKSTKLNNSPPASDVSEGLVETGTLASSPAISDSSRPPSFPTTPIPPLSNSGSNNTVSNDGQQFNQNTYMRVSDMHCQCTTGPVKVFLHRISLSSLAGHQNLAATQSVPPSLKLIKPLANPTTRGISMLSKTGMKTPPNSLQSTPVTDKEFSVNKQLIDSPGHASED